MVSTNFKLLPDQCLQENIQGGDIKRDRFRIMEHVGGGSFGVTHKGLDLITKKTVVLKCENTESKYPQLKQEKHVYNLCKTQDLGIAPNFVRYKECEQLLFREDGVDSPGTGWFNVLIMDQLGRDTLDLFTYQRELNYQINGQGKSFSSVSYHFSLGTIINLGRQMFQLVKDLHEKTFFIHRDLKPDNFMLGRGVDRHKLFLIDFGLSKKYKSRKGHIQKMSAMRVGTKRYMSANAWDDTTQSRRDDLISLVYILAYFWEGTLPWCNLLQKAKKERAKNYETEERKMNIELRRRAVKDKLIFRTQPLMLDLLRQLEQLEFDSKPNYDDYQLIFAKLEEENFNDCFECGFEWDEDYDRIVDVTANDKKLDASVRDWQTIVKKKLRK